METVAPPTGTQAIDRAAHILTLVLEGGDRLTVGSLADATNLPKSTTSRLVAALERHGLLRRNPENGALLPGPVIGAYARSARHDADLPDIANDLLEGLAAASGETANLSIATNRGVEQISQVEGAYLLGSTNWIGRTVPLHASAVGKCFLANETAALASGPLEQLTPNTMTNRDDLMLDIEHTRQREWGLSVDEIELGLTAIGAPVRGPNHRVIAGISIAGPSLRITPDRHEQLGDLLVCAAHELSTRLGHNNLKEGAI